MPADRLWAFLTALRDGDGTHIGIPFERPEEGAVRTLARNALKSSTGVGWAARLFEECEFNELPDSVMGFLYQAFGAMIEQSPGGNDGQQSAGGAGEEQ